MLEKLLKDSWSFFRNHIVALSMIILPIAIPVSIFSTIYGYFHSGKGALLTDQIIPLVVSSITYPVYTIAVIFYIASVVSGKYLATSALWRLGLQNWFPYILLSILVNTLVFFGFILLIIPGVIFAVRCAFAAFELLLNGKKPLDAIESSWHATRDYMWVILGGFIIITIVLYVPYILIFKLINPDGLFYWIWDAISGVVYSILDIMFIIFAFRIYDFIRSKQGQAQVPDVS